MQNIWKYSLLLAFSIIIDQLLKGSAQSFVEIPEAKEVFFHPLYILRERNFFFMFGIDLGLTPLWSNRLCLFFNYALLGTLFWWTVIWRNRRPIAGWSLSLMACGIFSSTMDRYSHDFTLDYLGLHLSQDLMLPFSLGDLLFLSGSILGVFLFTKREKEL